MQAITPKGTEGTHAWWLLVSRERRAPNVSFACSFICPAVLPSKLESVTSDSCTGKFKSKGARKIILNIVKRKWVADNFQNKTEYNNLAKRNWNGSKKCSFCSQDDTIQHLFFDCHYAKFLWRLVHFCFNLQPPRGIDHMFGSWLQGMGSQIQKQLFGISFLLGYLVKQEWCCFW